jgi:integrase
VDGKFGFQLSDAPPRRRQLSALRRREPRFDPLVHPLLSSPAVHRLVADAEVDRDVTHPSASCDQVKDSLPKLRRITPSAHAVLLLGQQHGSPIIRLHKTQGSPRLDALTPEHIYKLHEASGGMARKVHMTLAMALNEAKQYGHRVSNAINIVDKPDHAPSRAVALSDTEAKQLLVAAKGDPLEALYVLAVTLGIRQGELLALRWQDIEFELRQIHITGNLTRLQDGRRVISKPKTAASVRTLVMPQVCVDALARTAHTSELVLPGPDGKPWVASSFYKRWEAMRKRAGLKPIRFHDLRHTADTLALDGGASILAVMKTMGHTSRSIDPRSLRPPDRCRCRSLGRFH